MLLDTSGKILTLAQISKIKKLWKGGDLFFGEKKQQPRLKKTKDINVLVSKVRKIWK